MAQSKRRLRGRSAAPARCPMRPSASRAWRSRYASSSRSSNRRHFSRKPLKQFGDARPRELVANWMICATANTEEEEVGECMAFHSDPVGGDGIIVDGQRDLAD